MEMDRVAAVQAGILALVEDLKRERRTCTHALKYETSADDGPLRRICHACRLEESLPFRALRGTAVTSTETVVSLRLPWWMEAERRQPMCRLTYRPWRGPGKSVSWARRFDRYSEDATSAERRFVGYRLPAGREVELPVGSLVLEVRPRGPSQEARLFKAGATGLLPVSRAYAWDTEALLIRDTALHHLRVQQQTSTRLDLEVRRIADLERANADLERANADLERANAEMAERLDLVEAKALDI